MVLSHAHIDHSGLVPLLGREGFRARIYATPATRDLCSIMLLDSANIQAKDAAWLAKKGKSFVGPLYEPVDVHKILRRFICVPYEERIEIADDVFITFHDAGHVLGSAITFVEATEGGEKKTFVFSGDIGRKDMPLLVDPWMPSGADAVLMESTYGNRDHKPIESMEEDLARIVTATYHRGGKIIIPSFSLERSQEVVYVIKLLEEANAIPRVPVYVDSPLTANVTEIFRLHTDCFDDETSALMERAGDPFKTSHIEYIREVEDSVRLNSKHEPCIIIASGGMCEFGRIQHHLKNNCEDSRNTILIVGFQAQHTLGRRIVERRPRIRIFGVEYALNAEVQIMNSFSGHAGRSGLIDFGKCFKDSARRAVLVHGEMDALQALQSALAKEGLKDVIIAKPGKAIDL